MTAGTPAPSTPPDWNARYRANPHAYGEEPNAFLVEVLDRLPSGRAFVPADGQGRNGIWLAEQGYAVETVDLSAVAVAQATERAAARGVTIDARVGDLLAEPPRDGAYDVVAAIYLHLPPELRRAAHAVLARALAPGGVLVLEAFARGHLALKERYGSGGPSREELHYDCAMLAEDFAGLEVVSCEEMETVLAEGSFHKGPSRIVRGLFRRP